MVTGHYLSIHQTRHRLITMDCHWLTHVIANPQKITKSRSMVCFISIFVMVCLVSFELRNAFNFKTEANVVLELSNHDKINTSDGSEYAYIPPSERHCSYIHNISDTLWIKPIEIALFAMQQTFKLLNISSVLYGGTLLSHLRHTRVFPWEKDGDLAFLLPLNYTLKLDEFLHDIFEPKLNNLYQNLNFTCIINTDAIYSLFNCRLIDKPGYVDAFAQYKLYNHTLYNKLQYFMDNKDAHTTQLIKDLRNEIINDNRAKMHKNDNNKIPFIWNEHYLDRAIHLKPVSILFPPQRLFWNPFYLNNYNISSVNAPQDEIEIATIYYGKDYIIPPQWTTDKYGICDHQKYRIETFCFGNADYSKYDRGGVTVQVTKEEIEICNEYENIVRNPNSNHYQFETSNIW
eukprot:360875_1